MLRSQQERAIPTALDELVGAGDARRAGLPTLKGKGTGTWATRPAMREGERRLAEQAEASYARAVRDWQAAAPQKTGASVTPGRASQRPSKGKVTRQTTSP